MMAASVTLSPTLQLGAVTKLFDYQKPPAGRSGTPRRIAARRAFLITEPVGTDAGGQQRFCRWNWFPVDAVAAARN